MADEWAQFQLATPAAAEDFSQFEEVTQPQLEDFSAFESAGTSVRAMTYGPIIGEHHRAAMVGPMENPLGVKDVALSPNLLENYGGGPYKLGQVVDAYGKDGGVLGQYRVMDSSWFHPGEPTTDTIEFRDREMDGQVTIQPSATGADFDLGQPEFALAQADPNLTRPKILGNLPQAAEELQLNDQEKYLYQYHLNNLYGGGVVTNPDGSQSTVKQTTAGIGGKTYNLPTIWDGAEHSPQEAVEHAKQIGLWNFPAYDDETQAQNRYNAMHNFMELDKPRTIPEIRNISPEREDTMMLAAMGRATDWLLAPGTAHPAPPIVSPEVAKYGVHFLGGGARSVAKMMEQIAKLPLKAAAPFRDVEFQKIEEGVEETLSEHISGFTVPEQMASLAAFSNPAMLTAFAVNVISKLPEQYGRIKEAIQEHGFFSPQTAKAGTDAGITDLMGFLALRGAFHAKTKLGKAIKGGEKDGEGRQRQGDQSQQQGLRGGGEEGARGSAQARPPTDQGRQPGKESGAGRTAPEDRRRASSGPARESETGVAPSGGGPTTTGRAVLKPQPRPITTEPSSEAPATVSPQDIARLPKGKKVKVQFEDVDPNGDPITITRTMGARRAAKMLEEQRQAMRDLIDCL